ncbi:MAG: hypothetical protein IJ730_00750 [Alphaproteobacteria bacterium]|nr:hypothetical protein [Alphaproteobacteria bacterium]
MRTICKLALILSINNINAFDVSNINNTFNKQQSMLYQSLQPQQITAPIAVKKYTDVTQIINDIKSLKDIRDDYVRNQIATTIEYSLRSILRNNNSEYHFDNKNIAIIKYEYSSILRRLRRYTQANQVIEDIFLAPDHLGNFRLLPTTQKAMLLVDYGQNLIKLNHLVYSLCIWNFILNTDKGNEFYGRLSIFHCASVQIDFINTLLRFLNNDPNSMLDWAIFKKIESSIKNIGKETKPTPLYNSIYERCMKYFESKKAIFANSVFEKIAPTVYIVIDMIPENLKTNISEMITEPNLLLVKGKSEPVFHYSLSKMSLSQEAMSEIQRFYQPRIFDDTKTHYIPTENKMPQQYMVNIPHSNLTSESHITSTTNTKSNSSFNNSTNYYSTSTASEPSHSSFDSIKFTATQATKPMYQAQSKQKIASSSITFNNTTNIFPSFSNSSLTSPISNVTTNIFSPSSTDDIFAPTTTPLPNQTIFQTNTIMNNNINNLSAEPFYPSFDNQTLYQSKTPSFDNISKIDNRSFNFSMQQEKTIDQLSHQTKDDDNKKTMNDINIDERISSLQQQLSSSISYPYATHKEILQNQLIDALFTKIKNQGAQIDQLKEALEGIKQTTDEKQYN